MAEDNLTDEELSAEKQSSESGGWIADQLVDVARRSLPGSVPGEVVGDPNAHPVRLRVIRYDSHSFDEAEITDPREIDRYANKGGVLWVNVDGLRDIEMISQIAAIFDVHRLALEDIAHPHQRAKVETYENQTFIVARMPELKGAFDTEQISIVMCRHAVITFQERYGDCLDPVRHRLREKLGRIRDSQHDYLVYALLDAIVDAYFPVLSRIRDRLDIVERQLTEDPSVDVVAVLQRIRTLLFMLRSTIAPHQEAVAHLLRDQTQISDETRIYLRDCADHVSQVLDMCETTRELSADLRDYCFAEISFHQNETVKTLTILASVFIPLSFIAGFYGMNFNPQVSHWNMPETQWKFGYGFAIGLMVLVAGLTLGGLRWMSRTRRNERKERFRRTQRILED